MAKELWRLPKVLETTGIKKSTLYIQVANGEFPKPVSITRRTVAWDSSKVQAWINAKIQRGWIKHPNATAHRVKAVRKYWAEVSSGKQKDWRKNK